MKILIVEDDTDTRSYIKKRLKERSCTVDEARDGKHGCQLAKTGDYDLLLLDYGLPEKNGFEVCKELRAHNIETPVIMISVISDVGTKIEGFSAGADDYIIKPFFFDELYARIQTIMRRPPVRAQQTIVVGDLKVNLTTQEVFVKEKIIPLTKKEFSLLEYLARNHGGIISRMQIAEHIWGNDLNPFSSTIETHMLNLRKKISSGKGNKAIHNIPGRGYKLDTVL